MRELSEQEIQDISGGKKFLTILSGALFGGVFEGIAGLFVAGPAGFVAGFAHGVYDGIAVTVAYEGAMGLTETLHPELGEERF